MPNDAYIRLAAVASSQHGVFTRSDALSAGLSPSAIDRRLANGTWSKAAESVYLIGGSPATWERAVSMAVLSTGPTAVASHGTAAYIHGIMARPRRIEVTTTTRGIPDRLHIIHRSTDLVPDDVCTLRGLPVTNPPRTLVDMGIPWREGVTERALEEAIRRGLTSELAVARVLHRVARKGRNGAGVMRMILLNRLGWNNITESQLEDEFVRIMRAAGIFLPEPQVRIIKKGGRLIARVDFVYVEIKLVIELDSQRYHSDVASFRSDRRRQNELTLEGYRVLRFTTWDVFAAPEYVVAKVAEALRQ
jgi:hypothetical protein